MTPDEARHHAENALRAYERVGDGDWTPQDTLGLLCAQNVVALAARVAELEAALRRVVAVADEAPTWWDDPSAGIPGIARAVLGEGGLNE